MPPPRIAEVGLARTGAAICNRIEGVYGALDGLREPMLIERLAGIESELYRLANVASDAQMAGEFSPAKGRSDGRK